MKSYQSGDVLLRTAELSSDTASVSIRSQMQGFDVWEDMAKPTVYATVYLYDSINLLHTFPIIGEEALELSFETPGLADPVTYKFRVFQVTNIQQSDNRVGYAYTLRCVSLEHFYNASTKVRQAFTGPLDVFVPLIVGQHLRSRKNLVVDATKGIHQIVSPKWNPFEAIDYAKKMAVSVEYQSSSYCFFENQSGFHFKTVEGMIADGRGSIGSRVFTFIQNPSAVPARLAYRSVIEHEVLERSDSIETVVSGALHARTLSFDYNTKALGMTDFRMSDNFQNFETPDAQAQMTLSSAFQKTFGATPEFFTVLKDGSRPEQYMQEQVGARNAFKQLLNGNITRVLVHGDTALRAGDVVELRLPESVGTTGPKAQEPLVSGNYIILRLRHIVTAGPRPEHQIAFDAAKVGFRR